MLNGIPLGNIPPHLVKGAADPDPGRMGSRIERARKEGDEAALRKVSREFEVLLVQQLLREMRKTVNKSDLLKGGLAMDMYEGMLDDEVARQVSGGPGIGLAEVIYEQLSAVKGVRPSGSLSGAWKKAGPAGAPSPEKGPGAGPPLRREGDQE